ncbi:hypothetical protein DFP72DRAFT_158782 [Ephemerocybe angulata]|uniref:Uncharacterized protein n=1 Tax=Ephemerocybe angulata TaxID=980116 RepID=A0A8H6H9C0_9AGAR|nr:hypothetical protein DFP72DRAFT_158782 [Tulosesus angulatus]
MFLTFPPAAVEYLEEHFNSSRQHISEVNSISVACSMLVRRPSLGLLPQWRERTSKGLLVRSVLFKGAIPMRITSSRSSCSGRRLKISRRSKRNVRTLSSSCKAPTQTVIDSSLDIPPAATPRPRRTQHPNPQPPTLAHHLRLPRRPSKAPPAPPTPHRTHPLVRVAGRVQEPTNAGAKRRALFANIEQMKLLILGMEQRAAAREENLVKTMERAEKEGGRFEALRKDLAEVAVVDG